MRRFSNPVAIVLSFYSKDLYRDVARNWLGAGIVYLLMMTLLSVVPPLVKMQTKLTRFAREQAGPLLDQTPPVVVRDGHVSSPVEQPYFMRSTNGRPVVILDTTGRITTLDSTEAQVLVTATRLMIRKSRGAMPETRVFELMRVQHFELDRAKATRWMQQVVKWFALALSPIVFVGVFVFRLCQVLLLAALGLSLASQLRTRLGFAALMRLAVVAFTPTFVLDTLRGTAGVHVTLWWLLSLVIALVYMIFAIQANREPAPASEVVAPPLG